MVRPLNVDGDGQGDLAGHGGEHRAVLVYQIDSYLWLAKGPHEVVVYEGGYETFRERYEVAPGSVFEVHLKMKKGNATPAAPAETAPPKGAI